LSYLPSLYLRYDNGYLAQTFITMIDNDVRLTAKEIEIVQLICQEKMSKEIAAFVHLAHRTVEKYRERIFEKTGVVNMVGLCNWAVANGYWDPKNGKFSKTSQDAFIAPSEYRKVNMQDPVEYLKKNKDVLFQIIATTAELAFFWTGQHFSTIETGEGSYGDGKVILRNSLVEECYVAKRYAMRDFEWGEKGMTIHIVNLPGIHNCSYYHKID
jgi:DNA-binding CsgD family transcriptional regulator